MSYAGKPKLKLKAQELRRQGLSVKEIEKRLKVSRSSVSLWIRDIKLTNAQLEKLYLNKKTGQLRGCIIAANNKKEARLRQIKELKECGIKEIGKMRKRDRFIAGVSMYFAEGSKTDSSVQFSNSDPRAIKFMADWMREFCKPSEDRFRASIYIHDNLNISKAKKFWSKLIDVPLDQFTKTYIVKNNPKRFRKVRNQYGVFRLTVSDVKLHRKLMGWIEGLFKN